MKKIMVIMCSLLLGMPVLSLAEEKKDLAPDVLMYAYSNENAKFRHHRDLFNTKVDKGIRAQKLAEKKAAKKKAQEAQDKGEGQISIRF